MTDNTARQLPVDRDEAIERLRRAIYGDRYLPDLDPAEEFFLEGRFQQAFHRFFDGRLGLINNFVKTDVYLFAFADFAGRHGHAHMEPDHNGVGN